MTNRVKIELLKTESVNQEGTFLYLFKMENNKFLVVWGYEYTWESNFDLDDCTDSINGYKYFENLEKAVKYYTEIAYFYKK